MRRRKTLARRIAAEAARRAVKGMIRGMTTQALLWAAAGTGFTFAMTTLGAAMVFFFRGEPNERLQRVLLGFAAGVMTAASVWSLLLPAIEQAAQTRLPGWLPAACGMLMGVVFLAALDALLPRLRRKRAEGDWKQTTLLVTAITLHNVPEGMAVGLAFALAAQGEGLAGAAALAMGIGIQNFPEGAAISLPLRQQGWTRLRAFAGGTLSGAVEPVFGVHPLMPWLLSFAAGAMLYVVVEELVPQAHSRAGTCGFVIGFLIMMVLDVALG